MNPQDTFASAAGRTEPRAAWALFPYGRINPLTWSFCVFLLGPVRSEGGFCVAAQRVAEVHTCVHGVSVCPRCFGRNHSRYRRTPLQLNQPCSRCFNPKGRAWSRRHSLTLSGQTGAQTGARLVQTLLPPRIGAEAFASGSQLELLSPEPCREGSENKTSRPVPQMLKLYSFDPSVRFPTLEG